MNQRRKQMKGSIPNKQRAIQTTGHVFQTMQFTGNILKVDK